MWFELGEWLSRGTRSYIYYVNFVKWILKSNVNCILSQVHPPPRPPQWNFWVRARLRSLVATYLLFLVLSSRLAFLPYRFDFAWQCTKQWRVHVLVTRQRHTDVAGCHIISEVLRCCLCDWWYYTDSGVMCRIVSLLSSLHINYTGRVYWNKCWRSLWWRELK